MEVMVDIEPTTNVWVPELAKSWELSDDGTEWTFVLEEGIQWHNGWGEFTVDDVFHSVSMNQRGRRHPCLCHRLAADRP